MSSPRTLFDKLWGLHRVCDLGDGQDLLYIDRVFLHERTGSIALRGLQDAGHALRSPSRVFCTMDHIVDTVPGRNDDTLMPSGRDFISATRNAAKAAGIRLFDIGDPDQGIAHVVSPEQGIALPGATLVCPDSHTCTLGGLGALAWGIGSTEAEHAMATGTLRVTRPKNLRVNFEGCLRPGVTAKDLILHLIARYGAAGGSGHAVEFAGPVIRDLPIEARMTLCNMAVEFSAFTGLVAPDERVLAYVHGRPGAPGAGDWDAFCEHVSKLHSDASANFDAEITIDCDELEPQVTWGTSPEHAAAMSARVPDPVTEQDSQRRGAMAKALDYMGLVPGTPLQDIPIDAAFIGSCTNSRLSDLRLAASYLRGRSIAPGVAAVCVPGSMQVKAAAEAEGLHEVFKAAGFEWRESGCSMCFYAGGETFGANKRVISSTNRNFEGRQGPGTRTHLASPLQVAASACAGRICAAQVLN
ncbi:MAG: 3-isopropylmalate dehydratase large subunit [Pseudomonadota bacterium]